MASDSSLNLGATAGSPSSVLAAPPIIHELEAKFANLTRDREPLNST